MAAETQAGFLDSSVQFADFWTDFDYQNATFSDAPGMKRGGKKFMVGDPTLRVSDGQPVAGVGTSSRMSRVARGAGSGAAAKLAYNVSLFLNREALIQSAQFDIVQKFGDTIRRLCPAAGQGGALVSYGLRVSKHPDAMGQHVASYNHKVGLLGFGPDSLTVYQRIFGGPSHPTIGQGSRVYKMQDPNSVNVVCYFWIFREA